MLNNATEINELIQSMCARSYHRVSPGARTVNKSNKPPPSWSLCVCRRTMHKYVVCRILTITLERNRAGCGEGTEWSMSALFYMGWSGEASLNKRHLWTDLKRTRQGTFWIWGNEVASRGNNPDVVACLVYTRRVEWASRGGRRGGKARGRQALDGLHRGCGFGSV